MQLYYTYSQLAAQGWRHPIYSYMHTYCNADIINAFYHKGLTKYVKLEPREKYSLLNSLLLAITHKNKIIINK